MMKEGRSAARMRRESSNPKAREVPSAAMADIGATKGASAAGTASLGRSIFMVCDGKGVEVGMING